MLNLVSFLCYRFKSDDERTPLYLVVEETFPYLFNIFNGLVQISDPPLEVAELIRLICKIFWSSIYVRFQCMQNIYTCNPALSDIYSSFLLSYCAVGGS